MREIIESVTTEYNDITRKLSDPTVGADPKQIRDLSKRRSTLDPVVEKIAVYESMQKTMADNAHIINAGDDPDITELAVEENTELAGKLPEVERELEVLLLPSDPHDDKDTLVEIRAGAGGDESALFAADLYRMYARFAETEGWKVGIVSESRNDVGGFKEIIMTIAAPQNTSPVYGKLKYESGVHRVQRIPETEKQGRIHTSTATVAILPEAEEVDLEISPKDLRIDTFASSGPGGQSVNTTMSAVRITHIPTNTVVSCQDGKSQHSNKEQAMKVLRSRILQKMEDEHNKKVGDERRSQVGTGDRSEKIRTYNIPQDRITDHRIKKNWSNVEGVLNGDIESIVTALIEEETRLKLAQRESA